MQVNPVHTAKRQLVEVLFTWCLTNKIGRMGCENKIFAPFDFKVFDVSWEMSQTVGKGTLEETFLEWNAAGFMGGSDLQFSY